MIDVQIKENETHNYLCKWTLGKNELDKHFERFHL